MSIDNIQWIGVNQTILIPINVCVVGVLRSGGRVVHFAIGAFFPNKEGLLYVGIVVVIDLSEVPKLREG
jgi:hypothetical protein